MFELIGGIVEALTGYLVGRFQATNKSASHISAIAVSLLCGLIFFLGLGIYDLFYPAPRNRLSSLILFPLGFSMIIYLIIVIDFWIKRKKAKPHANSE